jgi:response regulator RpfG family c-di-GMP phosphodiesterase
VDDEPSVLELAAELFSMSGFQVTTCNSAEEAKLALAKDSFDGIMCDMVMPEQTGVEFARELHAAGKMVRPFIFVTGYSHENNEAQELVNEGIVDRVFVKPLQYYEVADFMKKATGKTD